MDEIYQKIKEECLKTDISDPFDLLFYMMSKDYISMHGPEHHVLDGACLLTALHNAGVDFDLGSALDEMIKRGTQMPGATCGQWGMCGSSASMGAALAIIHQTGPLSSNDYYKDNIHFVSQALEKIGDAGGPRCCKRNAFLSMQTAVDFIDKTYGIRLPSHKVVCIFSENNKTCLKDRCPFHGK
jgi:hypothetical protein